jgi:predicted ATPase with chaperone activity
MSPYRKFRPEPEANVIAPEGVPPPKVPEAIEETELDFTFLADLVLKTVSLDANSTTDRVADRIKLPTQVAEQLLQHLYREQFIEIRGLVGFHNHQYAMLDRGWERSHRLFEMSGYVGPAPVSLGAYTAMIQSQERGREAVNPETVRHALSHLVLAESTIQTLGLVLSSRRSLFITGSAGNGKTTIAKALHGAQAGEVWIPYAIEVDGHVIKTFDVHNHKPVEAAPAARHDPRWIKIKRPLVIVGGELTIESMDLVYSRTVRFYEAPFQMKANGGTLVIDDFGRQRVDPRDLLNRWIIPLEGHIDYLTLHTGKKIAVPFENLLVFATNLEPERIVDEAFLRRMGYRLQVDRPDREMYGEIFRRYVESRGLNYDSELLDTVFKLYARDERKMASCEPRDLVERCIDICRFENRSPEISPELLELALVNYFGQRPN